MKKILLVILIFVLNISFGISYASVEKAKGPREYIIIIRNIEDIEKIEVLYGPVRSYYNEVNDIKGYWLNYSGFVSDGKGIYTLNPSKHESNKFGINQEAEIKYFDNNVMIVFPRLQDSKSINYDNYVLKIAKKDGAIFYSEMIFSRMSTYRDDYTAYFEVDSKEIDTNFELTEIITTKEEINNKNVEYTVSEICNMFVILVGIVLILAIILIKNKHKKVE